MIRFFRNILFVLVLCLILVGCSRTKTANNSMLEVQDKPVKESTENKIAVTTLNEISPIKEGTLINICWSFLYIRYNGQVYQIDLDKVVEKDKVGKQIGKVERFLPSSMVITGKPFIDKDGDSNYLIKGSLIYAFKGKNVKESIIVDDKGVFKEAIPYSN